MTLTLEVTGPRSASLGAGRRMVFGSAGGTIGRNPGDARHWTLSDQHVSSTHAVIRCEQGVFTIEDRSRNGTCLNSLDNKLPPGERHPLKHGDTIFIDPFDIQVSIVAASTQERVDDPFGMPAAPQPRNPPGRMPPDPWPGADPSILPPIGSARDASGAPSGDSVMRGLGLPGQPPPAPKVPSSQDLWRQPKWNDDFSPPAPVPSPAEAPPQIPDNWLDDAPSLRPKAPARKAEPAPTPVDPVAGQRPLPAGPDSRRGHDEPRPVERPSRPSLPGRRPAPLRPRAEEPGAAAGGPQIDLAEIFSGAGLDPADLTPEVARAFGQILRVVVQGTMDVLHARRGIKEEFRIEATMFEPVGRNNPLKFSAGVDDALHNLFVRHSAGYLGPVAAFEDAFDDLRHHQMAMLDGMRVAFEAMLARFDPVKLEEAFDRQQKKGARLPVPMKPRYWELYGDRFRDMVKDPETAFRELFGDEFRTAYREQLARLKAQRRSGKA